MIIGDKNLCPFCFDEINEDESICEKCQSKNYEKISCALPAETILQGKYFLGRCIYYDNSYCCYAAYDATKNKVVLVREVFPIGIATRESNGKNVIIKAESASEQKEAEEIYQNVYTSTHIAKQFNNRSFSVPLREMFEENGTLYMVSEYPEGSVFLSERLENEKISELEAKNIIKNIIITLEAVHSAGYVHGNIRPENILLSGANIYLTGYHYGKFANVNLLSRSEQNAKSCYASIEQLSANKEIDCRTDIYSLGALWYFMLTGKALPSTFDRLMGEVSLDTEGLPAEEAEVISKMCEISSADRYADIYELAKELDSSGIMQIKSITAKKKPTAAKTAATATPQSKKGMILILALILAAVIAIGTGVYFFFFHNKNTEENTNDVNVEETVETDESEKEEVGGEEDNNEETPAAPEGDNEENEPDDNEEVPSAPEDNKPEDDEKSDTSSGATTNVSWINNTMKSFGRNSRDTEVLGNDKYKKSDITSVEFCDSLSNKGKGAWDVSEDGNKSVMAWVSGKKLYIGAEGGINASDSSEALFYNYKKLTEVNFGNAYHTDQSGDMSSMFENCIALKNIEFTSAFDTSNVSTMSQMFDSCRSLTSIDLTSFNTSHVMDMSKMFWGCASLEALNLGNFSSNMVVSASEMFKKCTNLKKIDLSNFNTIDNIKTDNMFSECKNLTEVVSDDKRIKDEFSGKNKFSDIWKKN